MDNSIHATVRHTYLTKACTTLAQSVGDEAITAIGCGYINNTPALVYV